MEYYPFTEDIFNEIIQDKEKLEDLHEILVNLKYENPKILYKYLNYSKIKFRRENYLENKRYDIANLSAFLNNDFGVY